MTNNGVSDETIQKLIEASNHYADLLRVWQEVHLAWKNGEATIEQDRAADEARRAAFEQLKKLEAESGTTLRALSPALQSSPKERFREQEAYDAYDHEAIANEPV